MFAAAANPSRLKDAEGARRAFGAPMRRSVNVLDLRALNMGVACSGRSNVRLRRFNGK